MMNHINCEKAIVNRGNWNRLKNVMRKAKNGEKLTIGFIGGSITHGSVATKDTLCYAYRVYQWWCDSFPEADFTYVNAGIGATDSQFACARVHSDLLFQKPDFVVVEFSVNDLCNEHYMETYEGLIRNIYCFDSKPAILLVHNVFYDDGRSAEEVHKKVGAYYNLPSVSMKTSIYASVASGDIKNELITPDNLHPNDLGHELVASVISYFLEQVKNEMNIEEADDIVIWEKPLTANAYQQGIRYQNNNCNPLCNGFEKDSSTQNHITDVFKNGWEAHSVGDSITFEIYGSCLSVQYRKTIQHPAPVAELILDDAIENAIRLDANFDQTWGDCLFLQNILIHGEDKLHKITIRIIEKDIACPLPFYLVSVLSFSQKEILFLNPIFTHNIWGGERLKKEFGYAVEGSDIGECWGISAHPNAEGTIRGGRFKGNRLSNLWNSHPELFGESKNEKFPLLVKIIDAKNDLSIQVHPDDSYAFENENGSFGKTECWYVLDCSENASLVIGHNAKTKEELKQMILNKQWNCFIREIPVKKGDFIQIDPGTVHAIKGGLLILETQQNSDITYRVYDYDRLSEGKPRQLHITQSIDVITVPAKSVKDSVISTSNMPKNCINKLYSNKYYTVSKLNLDGNLVFENKNPFILASVISGEGYVNGYPLKKGDHFIIPKNIEHVEMNGIMDLILSNL